MKVSCQNNVIYIRQNPSVRTIFVKTLRSGIGRKKYSIPKSYFLSFPYIQFEIYINRLQQNENAIFCEGFKILFSKDSNFTKLYLPPLPSVDEYGWVCLGSDILMQCTSKVELVKNLLQSFWSVPFLSEPSEWSDVIVDHYRSIFTCNGPIIDIIPTWEEFTKLDHKFIFDIPYAPYKFHTYKAHTYEAHAFSPYSGSSSANYSQFNWIDWIDWKD